MKAYDDILKNIQISLGADIIKQRKDRGES